jgi:transposase-like protein
MIDFLTNNKGCLMGRERFTEEFKIEAIRQITDEGFQPRNVAQRLEISSNSFYALIKQFGFPAEERVSNWIRAQRQAPESSAQTSDVGARYPKKSCGVLCQGVRVRYAFIRDHAQQFAVPNHVPCDESSTKWLIFLEANVRLGPCRRESSIAWSD